MELTKCVVVLGLFSISLASPLTFYNETESLFKEWMKEHGKEYGSQDEYNYRIKVFAESLITIEQHNAGDHSYTLGLTPFADVTFEEFADQYLMQAPQHCSATHKGNHKRSIMDAPPPDAVDWRKKGVVSKVKDQGQCGSCWTFSSTGALEAHMAIQTGEHLLLSEQQLVDCAQAFDNHGCKGGLPSHAFEYVHYNPGIMTEEDYPYKAKDGKCTFVEEKAKAFVKDVFNITEGDENELQEKVANKGPVSIAYQVVSDFRLYKKGVYTDSKKECKNGPMDVNHAVLAVGYDFTMSEYKQPYWIVKNSWGTKFGMEGYFYMEAKCNLCGMAVCNSYPDVYGV